MFGVARVEDFRAGDCGHGEGLALDRSIPLGAQRREEVEHLRRQQIVHQAQLRFVAIILALQIEIHREHHQHRILGLPGGGLQAEHQVFERLDGERTESGVDALGVGFEQGAIFLAPLGQHAPGDVAKAMDADFAIGGNHGGADDFGQLAGRVAPQQIHLKIAILTVHESQGIGHVGAVLGADRGNAQRVALDRHGRRDVAAGDFAIELRQAAGQLAANPDGQAKHDDDEQDGRGRQDFEKSFSHGMNPWSEKGPLRRAREPSEMLLF